MFRLLRDALIALLVLATIGMLAATYFIRRFSVGSGSMEPTIATGDVVWGYRLNSAPQRGDIVAFGNPTSDTIDETLLKRVIALPGERIEAIGGIVYINYGEIDETVWFDAGPTQDFGPFVVGPDQVFVMGDNRAHSIDSRSFGPITIDAITHRLFSVERDALG